MKMWQWQETAVVMREALLSDEQDRAGWLGVSNSYYRKLPRSLRAQVAVEVVRERWAVERQAHAQERREQLYERVVALAEHDAMNGNPNYPGDGVGDGRPDSEDGLVFNAVLWLADHTTSDRLDNVLRGVLGRIA